jgi:hypothetical protein
MGCVFRLVRGEENHQDRYRGCPDRLGTCCTPDSVYAWLVAGPDRLGVSRLEGPLAGQVMCVGRGQAGQQGPENNLPRLQLGQSRRDEAEMVATRVQAASVKKCGWWLRRCRVGTAGGRLSTPLGLTHHQRRHQLRGTPAVADADAAPAARIPTEDEELCLQEEAVFFSFGEHVVTGFLTKLSEPSPSSLSDNPAADFGGKSKERLF